MAVPSEYAIILNDLNRDVLRTRPVDPLQFCANWFNNRLEEQRVAHRSSAAAGLATTGSGSLGVDPLASSGAGASSLASSASPTSTALFGQSNPFGGQAMRGAAASGGGSVSSAHRASLSSSSSSNDTADEEMSNGTSGGLAAPTAFLPPTNFNLGRRTSVSAESLAPGGSSTGSAGGAGTGAGSAGDGTAASSAAAKTVIPKTDSQMQRIKAATRGNLLFRNLEEDQEVDVLLAMKEVKVNAGVAVIEQGAQGDYFYVVESGTLDVYVKPNLTNNGSASGSVTSESDDGTHRAATTAGGLSTADLGDKKISYGPGNSFGELALLYLQPRAATVLSTSPCTLWALDRVTFRSILMETNSRKRAMYESFLKDVSLFEHLNDNERAKISDALEVRSFEIGERPVKQGERGTEFFIIVEGFAEVKKRKQTGGSDSAAAPASSTNAEEEQTIGRLGRGDYFGELALLNNAPRAASIVAATPVQGELAAGQLAPKKLKVATLSERAFTRLLGPLAGIMGRYAEERYGPGASTHVHHPSLLPSAPTSHPAPAASLAPHERAPVGPTGLSGGTWNASSPFGAAPVRS